MAPKLTQRVLNKPWCGSAANVESPSQFVGLRLQHSDRPKFLVYFSKLHLSSTRCCEVWDPWLANALHPAIVVQRRFFNEPCFFGQFAALAFIVTPLSDTVGMDDIVRYQLSETDLDRLNQQFVSASGLTPETVTATAWFGGYQAKGASLTVVASAGWGGGEIVACIADSIDQSMRPNLGLSLISVNLDKDKVPALGEGWNSTNLFIFPNVVKN